MCIYLFEGFLIVPREFDFFPQLAWKGSPLNGFHVQITNTCKIQIHVYVQTDDDIESCRVDSIYFKNPVPSDIALELGEELCNSVICKFAAIVF